MKNPSEAYQFLRGRDGRINAARNNLVRQNAAVVKAISEITDEEAEALGNDLDTDALVAAAENVRGAVTARLAKVPAKPKQEAAPAAPTEAKQPTPPTAPKGS